MEKKERKRKRKRKSNRILKSEVEDETYIKSSYYSFNSCVISVILFVTGKRHDILIENNLMTGIKYSINGEPYKTLDAGKKALGISKGVGNVIFIKTADNKVIEKELPSKNINLFINQAINNGEDWYKESEK